jgi:pimeloyl-ACP methyl ester carboxylesterase
MAAQDNELPKDETQMPIRESNEAQGVAFFKWHQGQGDALYVLIHGYASSAENMSSLVNVVKEKDKPSILIPQYASSPLSRVDPNIIVRDILRFIDRQDAKMDFKTITLVGHSLGALLARKVYVCSQGEKEASFEQPLQEFRIPRKWRGKVHNIVLLAGLNRGWQISEKMSLKNLFLFRPAEWLYGLLMPFEKWIGKPLIFGIRRGAPFITQLRLQWLAMKHSEEPIEIRVTQLLGSIDDLASPEDNIDLVTGSDFTYRDVPSTNHTNILDVNGSSEECKERAKLFLKAISTADPTDKGDAIGDVDLIIPRKDVTDVVFVIHGIRDFGYWTQKLARKIQRLAKEKQIVLRTETSTYGYFPMLPFILPSHRRWKVEWLMDQYTENKALYPEAVFHYVGHSNGTYLLAKALEEYPACRFKHVVFAGSVVRRNYPWKMVYAKGQVKAVLNFVATGDWVVALFPKLFEVLRLPPWIPYIQDLGSAGHDGFIVDATESRKANSSENKRSNPDQHCYKDEATSLTEVRYIVGDHGAALREENWDAIAEFIVNGEIQENKLAKKLLSKKRNLFWELLGRAPYLAWLVIILAVCCCVIILVPQLSMFEWRQVVLLALFAWLIWLVLTKV